MNKRIHAKRRGAQLRLVKAEAKPPRPAPGPTVPEIIAAIRAAETSEDRAERDRLRDPAYRQAKRLRAAKVDKLQAELELRNYRVKLTKARYSGRGDRISRTERNSILAGFAVLSRQRPTMKLTERYAEIARQTGRSVAAVRKHIPENVRTNFQALKHQAMIRRQEIKSRRKSVR